ncbi:hypothetical protein FOA52_009513 [Chlamydomonas sp. UWO 241]|nr:hypothetical protein FOA52_009513 [Chlamydomonas sp. UWO 241]
MPMIMASTTISSSRGGVCLPCIAPFLVVALLWAGARVRQATQAQQAKKERDAERASALEATQLYGTVSPAQRWASEQLLRASVGPGAGVGSAAAGEEEDEEEEERRRRRRGGEEEEEEEAQMRAAVEASGYDYAEGEAGGGVAGARSGGEADGGAGRVVRGAEGGVGAAAQQQPSLLAAYYPKPRGKRGAGDDAMDG